jgi:hypothetical protein
VDVEPLLTREHLSAPARSERAPFPLLGVVGIGGEEQLEDLGLGGLGELAQRAVIRGDVPPLEVGQSLRRRRFLDECADVASREDHRHTLVAEQLLRDGEQEAGAVPGLGVRRHRAPVHDPAQRLQAGLDDRAAGHAVGVRDEADATGVARCTGVVQVGVGHAVHLSERCRE